MRLFAAIVPPRDILEEVTKAVDGTRRSAPVDGRSRRRLFSSKGTHAAGRPITAPLPDKELDRPAVERMYIPITNFGNVTLSDSVKLANTLRREAATWSRPTVHFVGGGALEFSGDESVWAKLEGDVDGLMTIGRGVPQVVQRVGFFVDRRQFRPWLSVGTINEQTTAPYLQTVVDALDALHGRPWTVDCVSLMQRPPQAGDADTFELMEDMPLSGS